MYVIATVTLVIALVVLLILGFLRVARELLSRGITEIPSPHEVGFQQIERESGRRKLNIVDTVAIQAPVLTKQSRKPEEHHVTA
jgi:hypothetical protein